MFNRGELKRAAKNNLSGRWGIMILICLVSTIIQGVSERTSGDSIFYTLLWLIVIAPIGLSISKITLNLSRGEEEPRFSQLAYGFKNIIKVVALNLIIVISVAVGLVLFIIPGVIIGLIFSQSIYVLADNPEIGVIDALKESYRLTNGYKGDIFILGLSFLGWLLLSVLTFGIALLWVMPYIHVTDSELYLFLKNKNSEIIL